MTSRNWHDFTRGFPEVAGVRAALPFDDFLLDGEEFPSF